jgi:ABC-2 type transport system ATP-binding protein
MTTALQDRIGYLPEERGLYKKMKVGEQLRFFAELKDVRGKNADARIDHWLAKLQLSAWKDKRTKELSKGMQQKVQFITSVIHDPDLLILDEPFSGLDPVNVDIMKDTILELKSANKTIILSTHQMEIAEKLCDDVCMINRSRKVLDGKLRDIRRSFSRNAVALRFEGTDALLNDPELVANIRQAEEDFEVLLVPGANPQTLLKRLVDSGTTITRFELVEPTLHDIFIEKVREAA